MSMMQPIQPVEPAMTEAEWRQRMLNNARTTAAATRFIAIVVAIGVVASVIIGIVIGVQVGKVANQTSLLCQSQGGPVAGC